MKRYFYTLVGLFIFVGAGAIYFEFYPYLFAKTVVGKIQKVERVNLNVSLMQMEASSPSDQKMPRDLFSFAIGIQTPDGEVHTASSEDRQWAAVEAGLCVKAKYFPYAPWNLSKAGTYYGARLLESHVCP